MVTISSEKSKMYKGAADYRMVAMVPHEWASKNISPIVNTGHGYITTAYKGITIISLTDTNPKFAKNLAKIINLCTKYENSKVGRIDAKIEELQKIRNDLVNSGKGKL